MMMPGTSPLILSIAILAAILLAIGGGRLLLLRADRTKGALMIVAALVLLGNVLVWAWPVSR